MGEVVLDHVTKIFGSNVFAVNDLDLTIKDREFMVLLGPSGCGKTTTLRMIAGLETPTEGNIYIDGKPMKDVPPQKRDVAMVFQSYALYPHMKVYDNIAIPLKIRKVPKSEIRKRVKETAELLRIDELLDRKPRELSGGQRQRVALGRAIIRQPKAFLMDEPLSNLDAKLRIRMRAELRRLHRRLKTTTIYVTHDQEEAMTVSDRIAIMKDGILQQLGSPIGVYEQPENLFVGTFIGSPAMNTFEGTVVEKNGELLFDSNAFTYPLPKNATKNIEAKEEVILGVRPEHITVTKETRPDAIEAKIDIIELIGRELHLEVRVRDETLTAVVDPTLRLSVGEDVWVQFDKERIYLFRKEDHKIVS